MYQLITIHFNIHNVLIKLFEYIVNSYIPIAMYKNKKMYIQNI